MKATQLALLRRQVYCTHSPLVHEEEEDVEQLVCECNTHCFITTRGRVRVMEIDYQSAVDATASGGGVTKRNRPSHNRSQGDHVSRDQRAELSGVKLPERESINYISRAHTHARTHTQTHTHTHTNRHTDTRTHAHTRTCVT